MSRSPPEEELGDEIPPVEDDVIFDAAPGG
jgi:hypothetical protein